MLRINSDNMLEFFNMHKTQVITQLLQYIPELLQQDTDDVTAFVSRIIQSAANNNAFKYSFRHRSDSKVLTKQDVQAFVQYILTSSKQVDLKKPIFEPHMQIEPSGKLKAFQYPVKQIQISWKSNASHLECWIHYVEGDSEIVETWPI